MRHGVAPIFSYFRPTAVLFSASSKLFQHDIHWWNFAWTCTLIASRSLSNLKGQGQGHVGFCVFVVCEWYCWKWNLTLFYEISFARWRQFITAHGSDWGYSRAVLSLEQGLTILSYIQLCTRLSSLDDCTGKNGLIYLSSRRPLILQHISMQMSNGAWGIRCISPCLSLCLSVCLSLSLCGGDYWLNFGSGVICNQTG